MAETLLGRCLSDLARRMPACELERRYNLFGFHSNFKSFYQM
jgi:hypothetical protein